MRYTGQPLKRVEDPHLVTGKGSCVDDVQLPGMLHAAVLRSPHAHTRLRTIDVARHIDTSLTPEKIWRALHGAEGDRRNAATAAR